MRVFLRKKSQQNHHPKMGFGQKIFVENRLFQAFPLFPIVSLTHKKRCLLRRCTVPRTGIRTIEELYHLNEENDDF